MSCSESAEPKEQSGIEMSRQETGESKDEINLIDYFIVVWKRKCLILWGSILPTFITGLIIFLGPRYYKITYLYNTGLDEKNYTILLDWFYCAENLERIVNKLNENGLNKYARRITETKKEPDLKKLVNLGTSPSFFEAAGSSGTDIEKLQKIQQAKGTLLIMAIRGWPKKDMSTISAVIRDDFEKVVPIYFVKEELISNIKTFKAQMADIERDRFGLELGLTRKKAVLEKLKNLQHTNTGQAIGNTILQFNDAKADSAYLPLAYQIEATDSQVVNLEEDIKTNEEKYNYYRVLLNINGKLFDKVVNKISAYYTIQGFHSFVTNMVNDYKEKESIDYLNAYIKRIENRITDTIPVTEKPTVYPIAKGMAKKSGIVFVISLMISIFATFLWEGLEKSRTRIS